MNSPPNTIPISAPNCLVTPLPRCLVTPRAIEFIVACVIAAVVNTGDDSYDAKCNAPIVPAKR